MKTAAAQKQTKKQGRGFGAYAIYKELRNEILALELEPGQSIDESGLAQRFEVSRSPIREAFVRLVSENLLQTLPNKGTIVAPLRIEEFPQYVDALDLTQRAVTRLAAEYRSEADLISIRNEQDRFEACVKSDDILGMIQRNRDFHVAIAMASQNRYLATSYKQILDDGRRFLRVYFKSFGDVMPTNMSDPHEDMIAAIRDKNADLAEELAHRHTKEMQQCFLDYLGTSRLSDFRINL